MTDARIKVGDVCHDLVERGKLQVIARAADSVSAYREAENFDLAGYKSHPLLDVGEDEPVYTCVYLPNSPTVSFSGTYDFPQSRLARIPVEEANQQYVRIQHDIITVVLSTLLARAHDKGVDVAPADVEHALTECWPTKHADLLEDAIEIAQANTATWGDGDE